MGKSADSTFLSASVDDPDDAFVGFTYVAPMEEVLHEWEASARDKQIKKSASASLCAVWWSKDLFRDWNIACAVESRRSQDLLHPPRRSRARCLDSLALLFGWRSFHCLTMTGCFLWIVLFCKRNSFLVTTERVFAQCPIKLSRNTSSMQRVAGWSRGLVWYAHWVVFHSI